MVVGGQPDAEGEPIGYFASRIARRSGPALQNVSHPRTPPRDIRTKMVVANDMSTIRYPKRNRDSAVLHCKG